MTRPYRRATPIAVLALVCAGAAAVVIGTRSTTPTSHSASGGSGSTAWRLQEVLPALQLLGAARSASRQAPPGIVRTAGTHLVLDGQPWRFVGFNDYQLTSQSYSGYTCGGEHSDAEVATDFAQMHQLGVTVVRTWFFQSYMAGRGWSAFDRVLTDAAKYGIRVIPVLSNQWGTCEDFNRAPTMYKSLGWYRSGYKTELDYGLPLSYRSFAIRVAQHYARDPRIAFWQLMNEAEGADSLGGICEEQAAAVALRAFADDMTAALKASDPAHLVSFGTIGGGQCGIAGSDYSFVHAGAIDLCEGHDYTPMPQLTPRGNPCKSLNKPMFIGERGFNADVETGRTTPLTLKARAAYVDIDVTSAFEDDGCQGYLLWTWTSGGSESYGIALGDPVGPVMTAAARNLASPEAVYAAVLHSAEGIAMR